MTTHLENSLRHRLLSKAPLLRKLRPQFMLPKPGDQTPLTVLREGGEKAPLVLVHSFGGSLLCYSDLVTCLDDEPDLPIYGLEANGQAPTQSSVEQMGREYLRAISRHVGSASYHLAGWSFGGLVAFEMARQLREANKPAASLLLIDTSCPPSVGSSSAPASLAARALGIHVTPEMIGGGTNLTPEWIVAAARHTGLKQVLDPDAVTRLIELAAVLLKLHAAYRPKSLRGSLTYLRGYLEDGKRSEFGWDRHVDGEVTIVDVSAPKTCLVTRPAVERVAYIVKKTINGHSKAQLASAI